MNGNLTIEQQLAEVNRKLDMVMEELHYQRMKRIEAEDLISDLSHVGKDLFTTTVLKLDNAGVQLDYEKLSGFGLKLLRNLDTLNRMVELMESADDLMKDLSPILHQVGLDTIHKLHEFEAKGYFTFIKELSLVMDKVVEHFKEEDIRALSDNIITILETVKSLTQPDMLNAVNNAVSIYKNMDMKNIPQYSIWKVIRELNTPEMKKGLGFMITFLKNLSSENTEKNHV